MCVKEWIKKCVGYTAHLTVKDYKPKIGFGRNLHETGLSKSEALFLFENDFNRVKSELESFEFYKNSPNNIQYALLNLNFNMGLHNLLSFNKMLTAIINKDFTLAALELLDSKWTLKNANLARDIAVMIRQG